MIVSLELFNLSGIYVKLPTRPVHVEHDLGSQIQGHNGNYQKEGYNGRSAFEARDNSAASFTWSKASVRMP